MSNKYSYASILSSYERQGLTDFADFERQRFSGSQPVSSKSRARQSKPTSYSTRDLPLRIPYHPPSDRLRIRDSQDLPKPALPQTQFMTDGTVPFRQSEEKLSTASAKKESARKSFDLYDLYTPEPPSHSYNQRTYDATYMVTAKDKSRAAAETTPLTHVPPCIETSRTSLDAPEESRPVQRRRRLTNETAIWNPQPSSSSPASQVAQSTIDRKSLALQHPPTPPLTPKSRESSESYSFDTHLDELPPPLPLQQILPVNRQEAYDTPPTSIKSDSESAQSLSSASVTSPGHQNPSLTVPPRCSSLSGNRPSVPHGATSLELQRDDTAFENFSDTSSYADLDVDLEPLPPNLCNDPEFAILPDSQPFALPTISRLQQDSPGFSRASSFDSTAPPPIALCNKKTPGRQLPAILTDQEGGGGSKQKQLKKPKSTLSFLSTFGRSDSTPKSVPRASTTPCKKPLAVRVPRTDGPSIPGIFPSYPTPFSPSALSSQTVSKTNLSRGSRCVRKGNQKVYDGGSGSRKSSFTTVISSGGRSASTSTSEKNGDRRRRRSVRIAGGRIGFWVGGGASGSAVDREV